jgi:hypothetical protein
MQLDKLEVKLILLFKIINVILNNIKGKTLIMN